VSKRVILSAIFFGYCAFAYCQGFNIEGGVSLTQENKDYCIEYPTDGNIELKSPYDRGRVTRWSNDTDNTSQLGRFIEIEYNMGFEFEGTFMSQGKMTVIFSNLEKINLDEKAVVKKGTSIGVTRSGEESALRVFVITDTDKVRFLSVWTNDKKININGLWYWDPSFLFG
jgi:hypothetical protein